MYRTFITIAAALATLSSAYSPAMADQERWFISHLNSETCVPIDDIGSRGERVYYGTGHMHTPADFANLMRRLGASMTLRLSQDSMVTYREAGKPPIDFMFFNDKDVCRFGMALIEDNR
jgi:hypothetical protein